ncbi:MAG: signal peptidase II [Campylobacterales bacterium]|nr:signal peptidase II [Campylobacterales bacterium]
MKKYLGLFLFLFLIDQYIKYGFANLNWGWDGPIISLVLAYNHGVAFSMFEFLAESLKYIQLAILVAGSIYLFKNKDIFYKYTLAITLLYVGGLSNILDRFTYGAVVDYVYWHYKFDFAIFNMSDVLIDLAIVIIFYLQYKYSKEEKKIKKV